MDESSQLEKLQGMIFQHPLLATGILLGVIVFAYGLMTILSKPQEEIIFQEEKSTVLGVSQASHDSDSEIVVDVSGAVTKPGVYSLKSDARVKDALTAAGGMGEEADQERVSRELNLAQKLTDGAKLYIPFVGDTGAIMAGQGGMGAASALVNINTATQAQLEALPKIGAVTAQKIISNRPYSEVKDLVNKKVVGAATFSQIESLISAP